MMSNNYYVIYEFRDGYHGWYDRKIVRILMPIRDYFYYLYIYYSIEIFKYLPLRPYLNYK